jgi:hypothetical protein
MPEEPTHTEREMPEEPTHTERETLRSEIQKLVNSIWKTEEQTD